MFYNILSLLLVGCYTVPSSDVRQVVEALYLMDDYPDSAVVLLEPINDSIINEPRLTRDQLVSICYYKAVGFMIRPKIMVAII